jgi:hypothetical protein
MVDDVVGFKITEVELLQATHSVVFEVIVVGEMIGALEVVQTAQDIAGVVVVVVIGLITTDVVELDHATHSVVDDVVMGATGVVLLVHATHSELELTGSTGATGVVVGTADVDHSPHPAPDFPPPEPQPQAWGAACATLPAAARRAKERMLP